jgi:hypothetical protein
MLKLLQLSDQLVFLPFVLLCSAVVILHSKQPSPLVLRCARRKCVLTLRTYIS